MAHKSNPQIDAQIALLSRILIVGDKDGVSSLFYDVERFRGKSVPKGGVEGVLTENERGALKGFRDPAHYALYEMALQRVLAQEIETRAVREGGKVVRYHNRVSGSVKNELMAIKERAILRTLAQVAPHFNPRARYAHIGYH